mmetsp:Transcript_40692/g.104165  ORF Transcript_40692/g.104165 Transcript_40692/m.104165 type:complete len:708 (-) Transcript_40692:575-2698(-)
MPQDGDADELVADQLRLLHQRRAVLPHVLHYVHRRGAPAGALALAGHPQRVHERLWMVAADADEEGVDEVAHGRDAGVDARDDLRDDDQPGVDRDVAKALLQRALHVEVVPVVEPQCEQTQDVLQRATVGADAADGLAEGDAAEEPKHRGRDVLLRALRVAAHVVLHGRHVEERPAVPGLGPGARLLRGLLQVVQARLDGALAELLAQAPLPEAEAQVRARGERRFVRLHRQQVVGAGLGGGDAHRAALARGGGSGLEARFGRGLLGLRGRGRLVLRRQRAAVGAAAGGVHRRLRANLHDQFLQAPVRLPALADGPQVLEVRKHDVGVAAAGAKAWRAGLRDAERVVAEQLVQRAAALPHAPVLAAQAGKAQPGLLVLVHRQHQAAHTQQRLPHLHVALHPTQAATPHGARQRLPLLSQLWRAQLAGVAVVDHLLQLSQLLHTDHVGVRALVAFAHQRGELGAQQLPSRLHMHLGLSVCAAAHAEHSLQEGAGGGGGVEAGVHGLHVRVHLVPLAHVPRSVRGDGRHLAPHVRLHAPPGVAAKLSQALPLRQRRQAAQPPKRGVQGLDAAGRRSGCLLVVRREGVVPSLQLLVPALLELHVQVLLRVLEHADRGLRLAQVVVDGDERLDGAVRVALELHLLVVQRLGKRVALLRQRAQGARVKRQDLLVVLHELRQVEQACHNLGGDAGARQRRFQAPHQLLLMRLV